MKKTAMFVLAIVFLLGTTIAIAKDNGGEKNLSKPLEVNKEKVTHFEKKRISKDDRDRGDALEQTIIKGKAPVKPTPEPIDPSAGGVTGMPGEEMVSGTGKKYAIVVGLANYPGMKTSDNDKILPDLCVQQVPEDDATTLTDPVQANCKDGDSVNMEKTLIEKYGFAPSNVIRLSDADATFSRIEEEVMNLVGGTITHANEPETVYPGILTADDELVFFFSGHSAMSYTDDVDDDGEEDDGGIVVYDETYSAEEYINNTNGYAVTYNSQIAYDDSAYIWDGQLRAWFANAATDRIFFAFDTCNAAEMDDLAWTNALRTVKADGRVLAFSSGKNESSYTYYLGGANNSGNIHDSEGLFSHYFVLRAMYDGYADGSNPLNKRSTIPKKYDGQVAVEEAFSYAYPLVKEASSNNQTPHLDDLFTYDLLLGKPNPPKTVTVYANTGMPTTPFSLDSGKKYLLEASKVAAADSIGKIRFDAKYSTVVPTTVWTDDVDSSYNTPSSTDPKLLELLMNGNPVDWGDYNDEHKYREEVTGIPSVSFNIFDTDYTDNSEELLVNIYQLD